MSFDLNNEYYKFSAQHEVNHPGIVNQVPPIGDPTLDGIGIINPGLNLYNNIIQENRAGNSNLILKDVNDTVLI